MINDYFIKDCIKMNKNERRRVIKALKRVGYEFPNKPIRRSC
jgi:hypothetical protein